MTLFLKLVLFCRQLLSVRELTRALMLSLAAHLDIFRLRRNAVSDFLEGIRLLRGNFRLWLPFPQEAQGIRNFRPQRGAISWKHVSLS